MDVELMTQVGLTGSLTSAGTISLPASSVGIVSSWAGSYHVLAMAEHYDCYVVTPRTLTFPKIPGFSVAHPYQRLTAKIRDAGVTGNIGECVAAFFARDVLSVHIREIIHVDPKTRYRDRKAPDYLMKLKDHLPGPFKPVLPAGKRFRYPEVWPVESKARVSESMIQAGKVQALRQIVDYWIAIADSQPNEIGYGLIISFMYSPPQRLTASLLLPKDRPRLVELLRKHGKKIANKTLYPTLYG